MSIHFNEPSCICTYLIYIYIYMQKISIPFPYKQAIKQININLPFLSLSSILYLHLSILTIFIRNSQLFCQLLQKQERKLHYMRLVLYFRICLHGYVGMKLFFETRNKKNQPALKTSQFFFFTVAVRILPLDDKYLVWFWFCFCFFHKKA